MPFALRTSPPVARLNRWSDQTAISAKPSWRLRICSHMAKVSWEYWLENWPEPQWRSAILMVPSSWGFLTGMVRRRTESMSWKMAVLAPMPRARVRTEMMAKPGLRRRRRKAWRRSCQNEAIASPLAFIRRWSSPNVTLGDHRKERLKPAATLSLRVVGARAAVSAGACAEAFHRD